MIVRCNLMNQSTTVVQSSHDETPAKTDVRTLCVGVVGLGHMGSAFARNLIAHGYRTLVFDRNRSKREACNGAEPVAAIGDLVPCDVVFSSLPNPSYSRDVVDGLPAASMCHDGGSLTIRRRPPV